MLDVLYSLDVFADRRTDPDCTCNGNFVIGVRVQELRYQSARLQRLDFHRCKVKQVRHTGQRLLPFGLTSSCSNRVASSKSYSQSSNGECAYGQRADAHEC